MPSYQIQEASFDLPAKLKDKTLNIFALPGAGPGDFSIVISRDSLAAGMTLLRYTERQIIEMESKFSQFDLLNRRDVTFDSLPAVELDYKWVSHGAKVHVRQVVTLVNPEDNTSTYVLIVTATAKAKLGPWEQTLNDFFSSFKFRRLAGGRTR